ncbi:MAG: hypothetical protein J6S57_02975 [Alphaproteobacteria bacterium]|nr:hypothetical protein [Alphaproteobacteria bacterium]
MQKYKVKDIYNDDASCSVAIFCSQRYSVKLGCLTKQGILTTTKIIDLPRKVGDTMKIGDKVCVCQNKDSEDFAYIYRDGIYMLKWPVSCDKYSCKCFIKNLPGVFDGFKLDRATFKIAIARDCLKRDFFPTLIAWRNLRKMCLDEKYPILKSIVELTR